MKILQLTPRLCYPADDGGKIGIFNFTKYFTYFGAEVSMISLTEKHPQSEIVEGVKQFCQFHPFVHSTKNTIFRAVKSLFIKRSIYVDKHFSKKFKLFLEKFAEANEFDIIHADHSCMAPAALHLRNISGKPAALRLHNMEWTIWQRYAKALSPINPLKYYIALQARKLKNDEAEFIAAMNLSLPITAKDRRLALRAAPEANIFLATAGVDADRWKPQIASKRNPYEMICATTYEWRHNVDAMKWFVNKVLPIVVKEVPKAKLTLIGKKLPNYFYNREDEGINALGYVDIVQPYLSNAGIYIAPLFVGGGIRIKILEAMAMRLPVVATPISAEGLAASENDGVFVESSPEKFAKRVIELMKNEIYREELGIRARDYILRRHDWKSIVSSTMRQYEKLIDGK